jgi:hypothetical protein
LLGSLAGDVQPQADLGTGVALLAQAGHGISHGGVDLGGEIAHVLQGVDVALGDAAAVGAQDAAGESAYSSFSTGRRGRLGVNRSLTLSGLLESVAGVRS